MQMTEKIIWIGDHKIYYLEGGTSSDLRHSVIFLHGWGLSSKTFQAGLSILSQHCHVIAPDLPGFCRSKSSKYFSSYGEYATVLESFIKAIDTKPVHLIGQSMGGGISILVTTLAPSLVRSLVLIDSIGIPIGTFPHIFVQRLIELPAQAIATRFTSHHLRMICSFLCNLMFRTKNTLDSLRLSLKVDLRPVLSNINTPCLILWGTNDRTVPLSSGLKLQRAIKDARLIAIPNAHHEWSALMPEVLSSAILEHIKELQV
jgi:pimeloyl-ACP methyl ester carboxylesterase